MATRGEKYVEGKFANPLHPKDGYFLLECKDPRARRMLEFVISIFYPEKPARMTVMVGNTIFGTNTSEQDVDWALVMRDMIRRLLTGIGKSKSTPICPYLLHLYIAHEVVQLEEKKVYMVEESFILHDIEPEEDNQLAGSEDLERESLSLKEIRELQDQQKKKQASPPRHKVMSTNGRKDKVPQEEERTEAPKRKSPFLVIAESLNEILDHFAHTQKIVRAACTMARAEDEDYLLETMKELLQKQTITNLQEKGEKFKEEVKWLKEELEDDKKANAIAATKLSESLDLIQKMEDFVQLPTKVLNKARLFDEGLSKNLIIAAKVIMVLVDFNQRIEKILQEMRDLFDGLEVEGLVPLDQVPNISINTEELPTL